MLQIVIKVRKHINKYDFQDDPNSIFLFIIFIFDKDYAASNTLVDTQIRQRPVTSKKCLSFILLNNFQLQWHHRQPFTTEIVLILPSNTLLF